MRQPTVYLLSCGDELLFGHTVDTNAAWLADQCTLLGWRVVGHRTVGDVTPDIVDAFRAAAAQADVVIASGGLGPTEDDRTRNALAQVLGVELRTDPEAILEIEAMFRRFNHPMGEINKVQALIPEGATRIVNSCGTAPGIRATPGSARIFCTPGVPKEMKAMFDSAIRPELDGAPGALTRKMRRLHLSGVGESEIGQTLQPLMAERANPEIGTTVAETIVSIRMYANGETPDEADNVLNAAEQDIRRAFAHDIFGTDGTTLAEAVHALLAERGAKLVTAESCTGGMLASLMVDVPGVSDVYLGGVVAYANEMKTARLGVREETLAAHGAVSRETACEMASMPLMTGRHRGPVYSLSTTGVAGPDGGTPEKPVGTVWIACARLDADGGGITKTMRLNTVADRHGIRIRAAYAALDLLRRTVLGYPSRRELFTDVWRAE